MDLSQTRGLDALYHQGPTTIGIDTVYRSRGEIPEVFLRGCGVPDNYIEYMCSLVGKPIEYYSYFISYSSQDDAFARRLYNDLQGAGVRCWFAPEDLPWGAKIRSGIDQAIRKHEKLLLVLSAQSVSSDWVEQEVETAQERERQEKKLVLFPVRLDDAVMQVKEGWPAYLRNTRNIGDFTHWEDPAQYQQAFSRLLHDLKA